MKHADVIYCTSVGENALTCWARPGEISLGLPHPPVRCFCRAVSHVLS